MRGFADLFTALDRTTSSNARVAALAEYLATAPEPDRVWAIALLSGRRPRRPVSTRELRVWAAQAAGLPDWLFEEAWHVTGDLAETIALVLPPGAGAGGETRTLAGWMACLADLRGRAEAERRAGVLAAWEALGPTERLVFNKLITGGFRMGVSQRLMTRALAQASGQDAAALAHRLMGDWDPATTCFDALVAGGDARAAASRPYPFCLAHPLEAGPEALGEPRDWLAEWKWDGIRGQLIRRGGDVYLWSRGEELITERFPELAAAGGALPEGCALDGEVLAWAGDGPLPFQALQTRIGRKRLTPAVRRRAPALFLAYDMMEWCGADIRAEPLATRRARLELLLARAAPDAALRLSPAVDFGDWAALAALRGTARERGAEGLMLKRRASIYHAGRRRGDWWKWKLDAHRIDAVLIYAQAGHGRRANLFTDFTFALRDGDALVPVAKAYSGLSDAEFREITGWVRRNTLARFGPVRQVRPELVFEIAFDGVAESPRHKSGLALRFPRMARWRRDKPAAEADTLVALRRLLRR